MTRSLDELRRDAQAIWLAGVEAVRSERLVQNVLRVEDSLLCVDDLDPIDLSAVRRIAVVGAGKAGAGMAMAVEEIFGPQLMTDKRVSGWVNVPDDCLRPLTHIHLCGARPAGCNEPTADGARGAGEILRLVRELGPYDLCLCLISGGASALLPAPREGITLDDKLAVTRHLSAVGANIRELNTVRKQLSEIKGGGLLRACRAGQLITLIISDVMGDPLEIIGSGPTVPDTSTAAEALTILNRFGAREAGISSRVFEVLEKQAGKRAAPVRCRFENLIIGNNALAVDAAGVKAEQLGYSYVMHCATKLEGFAEEVANYLADVALGMRNQPGPDCLISGGEPVVRLAAESERGQGGRNQQLVLAAGQRLVQADGEGIVVLSGATDGEDGPTDAAGAWCDSELMQQAKQRGLDADRALRLNDAYRFFDPLNALLRTGPTHTNVCDVRVVVVDRVEAGR